MMTVMRSRLLRLTAVHGALTDAGYEMVDSDVEFIAIHGGPLLRMLYDLKQLKKMIDILEDNDDVQKVHHNCGR